MTITSTSIVSHAGMRFAGWVIACPSAATLCTGSAQAAVNGFTYLHNRCRRHWDQRVNCDPAGRGIPESPSSFVGGRACRDSRVAPSVACNAFVILASVARMSAATSGVVVLTDLRAPALFTSLRAERSNPCFKQGPVVWVERSDTHRTATHRLCRTFFKKIFEPLQSACALLRQRLLDKRANDQSPES
jgi:hypothetical protein